jgi:hypothetical protein
MCDSWSSLETAFLLRNWVVASIEDATDRVALAFACPLLKGCCTSRMERKKREALELDVFSVRLYEEMSMFIENEKHEWTTSHYSLIAGMCADGMPRSIRALLAGKTVCAQIQSDLLTVACEHANVEVLETLFAPPISFDPHNLLSVIVRSTIEMACKNGRADIIKTISPFMVCDGMKWIREQQLYDACRCGCIEIVELFGKPPFSMGRKEALGMVFDVYMHQCDYYTPFVIACLTGRSKIVKLFGKPPYSVGQDDARKVEELDLLHEVCTRGHADVLRELAKPPYSLGHEDAMEPNFDRARLFPTIAVNDYGDVLRALIEPPYSIGMTPSEIASIRQSSRPKTMVVLREFGLI